MDRLSGGALAALGTLLAIAALGLGPAAPPRTALAAAPPAVASQQDAAAVLATGLRELNNYAALAQTALAQNDPDAARAAYALFDAGWLVIEDGVRAISRDDYRSIEDAMSDADRALRNNPVDAARATALLGELQIRVNRFIASLPTS
jgi:hypothetical protein